MAETENLPAVSAPKAAGVAADQLSFGQMLERATVLAKTELVPKTLQGKPEAIVLVGALGAEIGVPFIHSLSEIHVIEGRPSPSAQLRTAVVNRAGHEIRFTVSTETRAVIRGRRRSERDDPDAWVEVEWTIEQARKAGLLDRWVEEWRIPPGGDRKKKVTVVVGDDTGIFDEAERARRGMAAVPDWAQKLLTAGETKAKDNWMKYPAEMLRARAASALCRMHFADVLNGLSDVAFDPYTPEEQGVDVGQDVDDGPKDDDDDVVDAELVDDEAPGSEETETQPSPATGPEEQSPEGDETQPPEGPSGAALPLAQQIAMRAQQAGIDRAHVISAVTCGRTSSAKEVTVSEGQDVLQAIGLIAGGGWVLNEKSDGEETIYSVDPVDAVDRTSDETPSAPDPTQAVATDEDQWTADQWRAFLKPRGVKVTEVLKEAQRLAREDGDPGPASLDELSKSGLALCQLVRGFVEDRVAQKQAS